mgnify:CR=1 FL=1
MDKIKAVFSEEECKRITSIPLSICNGKDELVWPYSITRVSTVKTGYMVSKKIQRKKMERIQQEASSCRNEQNTKVWKSLWSLNMKQKLKHFLWKCLHRIILVNEVLKSRTGKGNDKCKYCREGKKTIEHMFFFCRHAKMIWKAAPIKWDEIHEFRNKFWLWWNSILEAKYRVE